MSFVRSFPNIKPPARFDGTAWDAAAVQEVEALDGVWVSIDPITFSDPDTDPARPKARSISGSHAQYDPAYYRIQWIDVNGGIAYSDTFYIDDNAPNVIRDLVRAEMPRTWEGLSLADYYGDVLLLKKIESTKYSVLPSTIAAGSESDWSTLLATYVAKNAARDLIPAGIEYWMRQTTTVTATGTAETTSYTDPISALRQLDRQLQQEIERLKGNPEMLDYLTVQPELPEISDGTGVDAGLLTNDPYDFPGGFSAS